MIFALLAVAAVILVAGTYIAVTSEDLARKLDALLKDDPVCPCPGCQYTAAHIQAWEREMTQ